MNGCSSGEVYRLNRAADISGNLRRRGLTMERFSLEQEPLEPAAIVFDLGRERSGLVDLRIVGKLRPFD